MNETNNTQNLATLVSMWARRTPDAVAILTPEGALTYREVDAALFYTANGFRKAGLEAGDIVGIRVTDKMPYLIASLALACLGVGQFALQPTDPARVQRQLSRRLNMTAFISKPLPKTDIPSTRIDPPPDRLEGYRRLDKPDVPVVTDPASPCIIATSSGTTGPPKVGVLSQFATFARLQISGQGLPRGQGALFLPVPHLGFIGAQFEALHCLISGCCLALLGNNNTIETLIDFVQRHKINYLAGGPVHAARLLQFAGEGGVLFPNVKALRMSSTLIPELLRKEIQKRLTPNLYIKYGISEIGAVTLAPPEQVKRIPGTVGAVLPGIEAEIIDENDHPVPVGDVGRLRVRSAGMIKSYVGSPEESAQAFRNGWYYANDLLAATEEGALIHHGRADDLMIFDGINIRPAEIENVLLHHPAVIDAAAFPVKSQVRGDIPVAAVVTAKKVSDHELYSHCRDWLGIKSPFAIMGVKSLPRNAVGKVLKQELQRRFLKTLEAQNAPRNQRSAD